MAGKELRTKADAQVELIRLFPRMRADPRRLERAIERFLGEFPHKQRNMLVFKMYYGVGEYDVHTQTAIGLEQGRSEGNLSTVRKKIEKTLQQACWWDY